MKGLQDRNIHILDGTMVENKGKLILSKYKPIVCALKNYNLNSGEKFEPGPGSGSLRFKLRSRFEFFS